MKLFTRRRTAPVPLDTDTGAAQMPGDLDPGGPRTIVGYCTANGSAREIQLHICEEPEFYSPCGSAILTDPAEARRIAAWLTRAAAWQEGTR